MKIESSNYNKVISKYKNLKKQNLNSNVNNNINKDKIDISNDYKIFKEAMSELKKMDKVKSNNELNAIAEKIRDNSYKTDPLEIAQCIIEKCKK